MWWWGGGGRREIFGGKCQENISTVNCEKRVLFGISFENSFGTSSGRIMYHVSGSQKKFQKNSEKKFQRGHVFHNCLY